MKKSYLFYLNQKEPLNQERTYRIGRKTDNNIIFADTSVSRYHAIIQWKEDGFILIDNDSSHGTMVNGKKITEYKLRNQDKIRLGNSFLQYIEKEEDQGETPTPSETIIM